jgi:hypothetical protein
MKTQTESNKWDKFTEFTERNNKIYRKQARNHLKKPQI